MAQQIIQKCANSADTDIQQLIGDGGTLSSFNLPFIVLTHTEVLADSDIAKIVVKNNGLTQSMGPAYSEADYEIRRISPTQTIIKKRAVGALDLDISTDRNIGGGGTEPGVPLDDFIDGAIDTNLWSIAASLGSGYATEADGVLTIGATGGGGKLITTLGAITEDVTYSIVIDSSYAEAGARHNLAAVINTRTGVLSPILLTQEFAAGVYSLGLSVTGNTSTVMADTSNGFAYNPGTHYFQTGNTEPFAGTLKFKFDSAGDLTLELISSNGNASLPPHGIDLTTLGESSGPYYIQLGSYGAPGTRWTAYQPVTYA